MTALKITILHGATGTAPDELETVTTAEAVCDVLRSVGHSVDIMRLGHDVSTLKTLKETRPDLVFNLVDAVAGDGAEAARIPSELADLGLAFTGNGSKASLICASKPGMKRIMSLNDLPTPEWTTTGRDLTHLPRVIVKAMYEHASIGMDQNSVVPGIHVAREIEARTRRFNTPFFGERYIEGREFNLSLIVGANGPQVLPPAEILFVDYPHGRPRIVDYNAKWKEGSFGFENTPRSFDFGDEDFLLLDLMKKLALRCWRVFGLSGYARVDFRVDRRNRPLILEVNTNPCLAPDAGFAAAAACAGLSYSQLVLRIVDAARGNRKAA